MTLHINTTYTISHNGSKYYLDLFNQGDHMLFRIRSKGEFFRGGICRVGIDLFHWVKGLAIIPQSMDKNTLEVEAILD